MCKGDGHNCYDIPNATYDHIESVYGLWSNHPLSDPTVYPDDVLVHTSGYAPDGTKNLGYYRRFDSLIDTTDMLGNCAAAQPGYGFNEMYPCLELNHSFGYAITGLINGEGQPVFLQVSDYEEPNIRLGKPAVNLTGKVTCQETSAGTQYAMYRFNKGNAGVPVSSNDYPSFAD